MSENDISAIAEKYFSVLNPLASRIYKDISETRLAYENLWNNLDNNEKNDIINECVIKPEVSLKYALITPTEENEYFLTDDLKTFHSNLETGLKIIHEDSISYRDEFSEPFNVKTKSQLNLNIFGKDDLIKNTNLIKIRSPPVVKNDSKIKSEVIMAPNKPSTLTTGSINEESGFIYKLMNKKSFKNSKKNDDEELLVTEKAPILIPFASSTSTNISDETLGLLEESTVLKSGYDFLDNW